MNIKSTKIDAAKRQTRRGYATPRKVRQLKILKGNIVGGWGIDDDSNFASAQDANGFRVILNALEGKIGFDGGVSMKNTAVPFSGTGGMRVEHDSGVVFLEVSGDGDGLGSQQVLLSNADKSVYVGIQRNLSGTTRIIMGGLPTSSAGLPSGAIWNDLGTLKIVS